MQSPVVGDNAKKKLARTFIAFLDHWWVKGFIIPIFFLGPPAALASLVDKVGLQNELIHLLGEPLGKPLAAFLNNSALHILVGTYVYVVLCKTLYAGIKTYSKPDKELSTDDIISILHSINVVVGDKCRRLGLEVKTTSAPDQLTPDKLSKVIRPDQQLALLVNGIKSVFDYMDDKNTTYRVGLIRIRNNKPDEWVSFSPESTPPRTEAKALATPSSAVSVAIKTKSIVVIEDIQKELLKPSKQERRFVKGNTQKSDAGSQLCYPVTHGSTGRIEYVLTVAGNRKACLVEAHTELYSWIIQHFVLRILLEHNLLVLTENANGH